MEKTEKTKYGKPLTKTELKKLNRMKYLYYGLRHGGGITEKENDEFDNLCDEMSEILGF